MNKVLVVVDMQNDFISGALGNTKAQEIVPQVVKKIKIYMNEEETNHIIATRDTHTESYLDTLEGKNLPVIHCIKGSKGWQLADEISAILDKKGKMIDKYAFGSIALADYLVRMNNDQPIDTIELIGVCTDICVVSNAILLKNHLPEVEIIVDASCCAGVTSETHQSALTTMKMCHITVINE